MSQQPYRGQGPYGPQEAPEYLYGTAAQQEGIDIGKILVPVLSGLALVLFLGIMALWRGKAVTENELAKKRQENIDLRREKDDLDKEIAVKKRRLLLAGSDAFALLDESGSVPAKSADDWRAKCLDMERQREAWRRQAHLYRQKLTQAEKDWMHSTEGISIPDKYIEEEATEDGGRQIRFRVVSKVNIKLTNLVGSIGFYQNDKLMHEEPFLVREIAPQSTVDMVIRVPDRLLGYYEFAGHIKAVGR
jgi:hypothetical protein